MGVWSRRAPAQKAKRASVVAQRRFRAGMPSFSGQEVKHRDQATTQVANTTGAVITMNGLAPGASDGQRVGKLIKMRQLQLRLHSYVTAGTGVDQVHRVLVVLDHQTNGAAPGVTDILDAVTTTAFPNQDNRLRFMILYDKVFTLSASAESGSMQFATVDIPLRYITQYNAGTAGTVGDIASNGLFLVVLGTEAAGASAGTVRWSERLNYTD